VLRSVLGLDCEGLEEEIAFTPLETCEEEGVGD
jgi:hypothetical protein